MTLYNSRFSEITGDSVPLRKALHEKQILKLLTPQTHDVILDMGCNRGDLVTFLRNYSQNVLGCDVNREAVENSSVSGLKIIPPDKIEYEDATFDKIISSHVIEHISNLPKTFEEIERVLKPSGICVLIYPFEIIRGSNNMLQCWKIYGNPFYSRKLHVKKLNPGKIGKFTKMKIIKKGMFLAPFPTYYTVLKKNG